MNNHQIKACSAQNFNSTLTIGSNGCQVSISEYSFTCHQTLSLAEGRSLKGLDHVTIGLYYVSRTLFTTGLVLNRAHQMAVLLFAFPRLVSGKVRCQSSPGRKPVFITPLFLHRRPLATTSCVHPVPLPVQYSLGGVPYKLSEEVGCFLSRFTRYTTISLLDCVGHIYRLWVKENWEGS